MRRSTTRARAPRIRPGRPGPKWVLPAIVGAALLAITAIAIFASLPKAAKQPAPVRSRLSQTQVSAAPTLAAGQSFADSAQAVEVPDIKGASLSEARIVLETAGFVVRVTYEGTTTGEGVVEEQEPSPGEVLAAGSIVEVTAPRSAKKKSQSGSGKKTASGTRYVVVIDPGHQRKGNSTPEPIGPGSSEKKPSVTGGTTGVSTGIPEYEIVLQVSMNLRKKLAARGVKVIMTRMTNDVDLSNSRRASIANKAHADLLIRVHADGSPDHEVSGISTLFPAKNKWTRPISASSRRAAQAVQSALVSATGAVNRGTSPRQDLSGFNYSDVPAVLVETGFMSNPVEDRLLSSPHYQDKLASGMVEGIMAYLGSEQ